MKYTVTFPNQPDADPVELDAECVEDAESEASDLATEGWDAAKRTIWASYAVHDAAGDEVATGKVAVDPTEPRCRRDHEHDWRTDSVSGSGGGVLTSDVCAHCGCERVTDTWATDPSTGEQGLTSVSYDGGAR